MLRCWIKKRGLITSLLLLFLCHSSILALADIDGIVIDPERNPIESRILVFEDNIERLAIQTGTDGVFLHQLRILIPGQGEQGKSQNPVFRLRSAPLSLASLVGYAGGVGLDILSSLFGVAAVVCRTWWSPHSS